MAELPSGIVKVRLTGAPEDVQELAAILEHVTLHRKTIGTQVYLEVLVRAEIRDCRCGKEIRPCGCGDTSCLGWVHTQPGGHWCTDRLVDGRAYPVAPRAREGERANG